LAVGAGDVRPLQRCGGGVMRDGDNEELPTFRGLFLERMIYWANGDEARIASIARWQDEPRTA
jgi:hypothetical protein